jgi:hypothetical protein
MSILNNALQAMVVGIQDFADGSDARLKSALRNVHAAALLLFKEKLMRLSPSNTDGVLLNERIVPEIVGGAIVWRGKGKKTVDVQSIQDRFQTLNISVDWKAFEDANRIRNEIEHYFTTANASTIREAIAKLFGILSRFVRDELNADLRLLLPSDVWQKFIEVESVYEAEKAICQSSYSKIDSYSQFVSDGIEHLSCDECGSDLIVVNDGSSGVCRSCGEFWDRDALLSAIVTEITDGQNYYAIKDGEEPTSRECPECGEFGFIREEMVCAHCGESQKEECDRCGVTIPMSELDGSGYCSYCSHQLSKDD